MLGRRIGAARHNPDEGLPAYDVLSLLGLRQRDKREIQRMPLEPRKEARGRRTQYLHQHLGMLARKAAQQVRQEHCGVVVRTAEPDGAR